MTAGDGAPRQETIFTMEATPIKFGPGASADPGWEFKRLGAKRLMVVSDSGVIAAGITDKVRERIEAEGIETVVFDKVHVEPTAGSLQQAADFALDGEFDGFVGIGGGSSMDTAKVADLVSTHPAEIMDYVNPPVGEGRKPPSPLKPLVGHLAQLPATTSGDRGSRPHQIAAPGGDRFVRAGCRLPRRGVVHLPALRHPRPAGVAG
jgi:alcohol dehydrogenase class IV